MTSERIYELLNGGDWACAWSEPETLAGICRELSLMLARPWAGDAEVIAGQALRDWPHATRRWAELASLLERGVTITGDELAVPTHRPEAAMRGLLQRESLTVALLYALD